MSYVGLEVVLVSTNSNPKPEEIVEKKIGFIKGKQKYRGEFHLQNQRSDSRDGRREQYVVGECCKKVVEVCCLALFHTEFVHYDIFYFV